MHNTQKYNNAADRIYHEWDRALAENKVENLLLLYAKDAVLESPLVPHLLNQASGVCVGHEELKQLLLMLAKRKPDLRKYYRTPCLRLNNLIMWEYPRLTPNGEQMDFAEIMNLNDQGLIQSHRVYWGWRGVKVMQDDAYHRNNLND